VKSDVGGEVSYVEESFTPRSAMSRIKDSGYRTIVVAMDHQSNSIQQIADAAEEFSLNNGDYFYVWMDWVSNQTSWDSSTNVSKIMGGSAFITPHLLFEEGNALSPFEVSWRQQGSELVQRLNEVNPLRRGEPGYIYADDHFFQEVGPGLYSGFMFDAVVSVGLGACMAAKESDGTISGAEHRQSILRTEFVGATGPVQFAYQRTLRSSREIEKTTLAAYNIVNGSYNLTDVSLPNTGTTWREVAPFEYANGSNEPPKLLRDPPNQSYIGSARRALGLSLMSVVMLLTLASILWLWLYRREPVVASSPLICKYIILLGTIVFSSAIFALSFDEGAGWSTNALDTACKSVPWLIFSGHFITYASALAKIRFYLPDKPPHSRLLLVVMMITAEAYFALLLAWTLADPLRWERQVTNDMTGKSQGACNSGGVEGYALALLVLAFVPMTACVVVAWRVRQQDDTTNGTRWVLIMILGHAEVIMLSIPILVILRDQTTPGRAYVGASAMISCYGFVSVGLTVLPKMILHYRSNRGTVNNKRKRGARGSGVVTGLEAPPQETIVQTC